ncbi:hypothetical protein [Xenorhabdus bovienii]|uniref:Uncharacterized protein n=2 Tax=Xenorhabdus bovienii TaxID=40576 RepID=A0AAJ1J3Z3_XENBV|nr:hypothetical protein [Xenorhabdus bovienii]MCG3464053.1 hypothetical protein [Xenorhabdus bovienii]MCP9267088.1 hypothetical protein [Xenorhabdus bovienii subsp. africana]MDE1477044.1 hypothetical protein [Xenorhabdus bovienii]MDE1481295.1 hypothetical protein [Xenorhabdus bovienii]MDE1486056.1 hypothetical protein [Xenorhabdus bovienii]
MTHKEFLENFMDVNTPTVFPVNMKNRDGITECQFPGVVIMKAWGFDYFQKPH